MQTLFVLVYECPGHPLLPSVSHRVFELPLSGFNSRFFDGRRTSSSPSALPRSLFQGLAVEPSLGLFLLEDVCLHPASSRSSRLSIFIASCAFIFLSSSQSPLLPLVFVFAASTCARIPLVLKAGFAHISSTKSSRHSGTHCSSELCQPSPIHFMNHFLSTFLEHTCLVSADGLPSAINVQIFSRGHWKQKVLLV